MLLLYFSDFGHVLHLNVRRHSWVRVCASMRVSVCVHTCVFQERGEVVPSYPSPQKALPTEEGRGCVCKNRAAAACAGGWSGRAALPGSPGSPQRGPVALEDVAKPGAGSLDRASAVSLRPLSNDPAQAGPEQDPVWSGSSQGAGGLGTAGS